MSRRFDGFGMPDKPSDSDKEAAIEAWKSWYLGIEPDAEFIE